MLKFYKVCIRHRCDGAPTKIEFHTWTPKEYNKYVQNMREDYEKHFYHYSISRDNNNIFIEIEY